MRIEPQGDIKQKLHAAVKNGLRSAALLLVAECQSRLAVVNAGKRKRYKFKLTKGGNKATHTVYGSPSSPGEAPRQRTGWGKGHVGYEEGDGPDGPFVRIGVPESAIYLAYHEAGINYRIVGRQQRPWLQVTYERYKEVVQKLITVGRS